MARFKHQTPETSTVRVLRPKRNYTLYFSAISCILSVLILLGLIYHILIYKIG